MKHHRGRGNLDAAYLQEYSREHVWYEISMFFYTGQMLCKGNVVALGPDQAVVTSFALMESFVLHLRNLLDFFYEKNEKDDDVTARMYYDSSKLPKGFPTKPKVLNKAHIRAHKEMSHLTTQRLPPNDPRKPWNFRELMIAMKPLVRELFETASRSKVHLEFLHRTDDLLHKLDRFGI